MSDDRSDPKRDDYGSFYFANCCGRPYARDEEWLAVFARIADRIIEDIRPVTVLDAGCAFGFLVEMLRQRGVEADGIDVSSYAIGQVHESVRSFCRVGNLTEPLAHSYDLVVSIEVLEHMSKTDAEHALDNICASTDDVLFSSSPIDLREPTHVNVQPPEVWAEQFARRGFIRDVDFDASFVTPWAVRFRRCDEPLHQIVRRYERRFDWASRQAIEARAYAREIQTRLESTEDALQTACAELESARADAIDARNTVIMMESSRFWKLRNLWHRLKKALGIQSPEIEGDGA